MQPAAATGKVPLTCSVSSPDLGGLPPKRTLFYYYITLAVLHTRIPLYLLILQQVVELNGYVIVLVEGRDGKIKLVSESLSINYGFACRGYRG